MLRKAMLRKAMLEKQCSEEILTREGFQMFSGSPFSSESFFTGSEVNESDDSGRQYDDSCGHG